MSLWTYRLIVVGTVLSACLTGMHLPMLHHIIDHGEGVSWDVVIATSLLVVFSVAGAWRLLRAGRALVGRS